MTKRGNNEGSISKRSDGRWMARITLPGGKRKYFYGDTRAEVAQKLAAATRDRDKGLPVVDERETLGKFLDRWLDESVRPTKRPKTIKSYESQIRVHLKPALGKVTLAKLSPQHVQKLQNDMSEAGLAPSSVQYTRAVFRKAMGQALKWGLVARNVVTLVDPPTVKKIQVRPMTPEQARKFLEFVRGDRFEALYTVALATGMRQGELLGLRWSDVDLDDRTITVRHALQRVTGRPELVEPKTDRSRRTIPVPDVVVQRLRDHRAAQRRERLAGGDKWVDTGFVFTTNIGTPLEGCNVTKRFQRTLAAAGLPRQRFHDMRHSTASFLLAQGLSPRVVMETLGHSQISITMNTYAHVMPGQQREAADRMGDLLAGGA